MIWSQKKHSLDQNCDQRQQQTKNCVDNEVCATVKTKRVKVSTCAIQDDVPKIEGKHLVFKASIAGIKTRLLIDNGNKTKLINESFVRTQKISTFKLRKKIKLTLGNRKVVQKLDSACLIDMHIGDHHEQVSCYVASLDVCSMILGDGWLQTYNSVIDWKDCTMRFNSAACIKSGCLAHGVPCVEFAVGSKAKNRIGADKLTAVNPDIDIDIKPVNAKHFFQMARKKDHEGYI